MVHGSEQPVANSALLLLPTFWGFAYVCLAIPRFLMNWASCTELCLELSKGSKSAFSAAGRLGRAARYPPGAQGSDAEGLLDVARVVCTFALHMGQKDRTTPTSRTRRCSNAAPAAMPPPTDAREGCSGLVGDACTRQLDGDDETTGQTTSLLSTMTLQFAQAQSTRPPP